MAKFKKKAYQNLDHINAFNNKLKQANGDTEHKKEYLKTFDNFTLQSNFRGLFTGINKIVKN